MSKRRKQTSAAGVEQPVRFYKIVALSFLFLTIGLIAIIVFMTSKRATISVTTKEHPIDIESTVHIGKPESQYNISGTVTSTVVNLSKTYFPTGSKKETGTSKGLVTLHNTSNSSQPLIKTTRLLTPTGILFRLTNGVTVPAGGSVQAEVYADQPGTSGDVDSITRFNIPGLNATRQTEVYASSDEAMKGGLRSIGILSLADLGNAKEEFRALLQKEGENRLRAAFPNNPGVFMMVQHVIDQSETVGDEVSEFSLIGKATLAGVFYDELAVANTAEQALSKHIVDDVGLIRVTGAPPTVSLERVDIKDNTAELVVYHSGVETLNPESKQLQKMLFFGKDKEEVRRYLLKLDNVYGVDVTFRPVWVGTIPYVPDHVQVVVKKIE